MKTIEKVGFSEDRLKYVQEVMANSSLSKTKQQRVQEELVILQSRPRWQINKEINRMCDILAVSPMFFLKLFATGTISFINFNPSDAVRKEE